MKRAQEWLHALGPTGVLGIGVLIFCVPRSEEHTSELQSR